MMLERITKIFLICISFRYTISEKFEAAQLIKREIKVYEHVPAGINGYALSLTNELVKTSSAGQRHSDLL